MNQMELFNNSNDIDSNKLIDIAEACELLSISEATGRNWIKSGLLDVFKNGSKPTFLREVVEDLALRIRSGEVKRLKSRRNKTQTSGIVIPRNYLNNDDVYNSISLIINAFSKVEFSRRKQSIILAEYALQLLESRKLIELQVKSSSFVYEYCHSKNSIGRFASFIDCLLNYSDVRKEEIDELKQVISIRLNYSEDDILGLLYMALKCTGDRKQKGIYFTPYKIVHDCISYLGRRSLFANYKIVDPCCGTGNFLMECIRLGCSIENLHGYDTDIISVCLCRINLALITRTDRIDILETNIDQSDSLLLNSKNAYDMCIGNPPWGYEFDRNEKMKLSELFETAKGRTVESFGVFLEQSLRMVKQDGIVSFVLPESITNVRIHENIRKHVTENSNILRVRYWGDVFDGINCPAISLTLQKTGNPTFTGIDIQDKGRNFKIEKERHIGRDIWNLNIDDFEFDILSTMRSNEVEYLKNNADFALGIVTGDNKRFLHNNVLENSEPVLRGSNIYKYNYQSVGQSIIFEPERFQQVAPTEIYRANEKLIYRFICDSLVFAYDNKKALTLNSANILIPRIAGMKVKYILAVLNSRAAHFYFKLTSNSIKVLRSHIESLPIPRVTMIDQDYIIRLVDKIIDATDVGSITKIYYEIDDCIMKAYHMPKDHVSYIEHHTKSSKQYLRQRS